MQMSGVAGHAAAICHAWDAHSCSRCVPVQMSGWQGAQALHAEGGSAVAYTGMMDCLARTVREEGVRALFKVSSADLSLAPPMRMARLSNLPCLSVLHCSVPSCLSMAIRMGRAAALS